MDNTKRTINIIVSRITEEIKKASESEEFQEEVARYIGYIDPKVPSESMEMHKFVTNNINLCIKQMVSDIMGSYELRLCKPRD